MTQSGRSPRATRCTLSKALRKALNQLSQVGPAVCGVNVTFSSAKSGWFAIGGSSTITSRPAAAMTLVVSAVCSAFSSTTGPRQVLMRTAEGRIMPELAGAEHVPGDRVERHVERDDVGGAQQLRQQHEADAEGVLRVLGQARDVVVDDLHVEGGGPARDLLADGAQAHDAEGLALELVGPVRGEVPYPPLAGDHVAVVPGQRLRYTASISIRVCSATATELDPPLLATGTPARLAAATSSRS